MTLFEKIAAREIPADIVYEDAEVLAFLDIRPNNKGHTLVVPKQPFRNILDIDEAVFAHLARVATRIARAVHQATGADGINLVMNNEAAAGQVVFHAHLHVIPRFAGDAVFRGMEHTSYAEGESADFAQKIQAVLETQ